MPDLLQEIAGKVISGRADKNSPFPSEKVGEPGVKELTQKAIKEGIDLQEILNSGLLAGMNVVGARFKDGELFIPEVLVCGQALKAGMDVLKPIIVKSGLEPLAKFVIGTVKGDLHDIGKSLVSMMLQGAGFEVVDLGIDVPKEKFVAVVRQEKPQVLGISSLLTSTIPEMRQVIEILEEEGLRGQVKVMVGGAPVTDSYAAQIGADGYAPDAISAVVKAKELLSLLEASLR
jgi:5-methyltetrahydrofolate--homocysteine methyltransferase|tara:strand:+ start:391 stop:1086 length:696 start_codon:yes stop_codon:yes gene_type:complete